MMPTHNGGGGGAHSQLYQPAVPGSADAYHLAGRVTTPDHLVPLYASQHLAPQQPPANKKRKVSDQDGGNGSLHNGTATPTPTTTTSATSIYIKQEPNNLSPDHQAGNGSNSSSGGGSNAANNLHPTQTCADDDYFDYGQDSQMYLDAFYQCIRFTPFNSASSCPLYDANFKEM